MQKHIALLTVLGFATLTAHGNETAANNANFSAAMNRYLDKNGSLCLKLGNWPIILHEGSQSGELREMAALEAIGLVKSEDTEVAAGATEVTGKARRYTLTSLGTFVKETNWPLDVAEGELGQKTSRASQVTALEAVGLVRSSSTEAVVGNTKIKAKRFSLTDAGNVVQKTNWPQDVTNSEVSQKTSKALEMAALETAGVVAGKDYMINSEVKTKAKSYTLTETANPFVRNKREVESFGVRKTSADLCWARKALDKIVKWEGPWKRDNSQEARVTYTFKITNVADWARKPEVQDAFYEIKRVLDNAGDEAVQNLKLTNRGWEAVGGND